MIITKVLMNSALNDKRNPEVTEDLESQKQKV